MKVSFASRFVSRAAVLGPVVLLLVAASAASLAAAPFDEPPTWSQTAVWYQIFVERFRNGDVSNDPRPESMVGADPGQVPTGWAVTPWGHDWYELEAWARKESDDFYKTVAFRRYGGDLAGVLERLDYLQELGVTAIYFNPLNDAPSLHKYDARNYRHIDRHFGPDPDGDAAIIAAEDPLDPSTWKWTSADRLFLKLIGELHRREMRLIVDYSWNHTGVTFWAWRDLVERQEQSKYKDWYEVESFDDPDTAIDEFRYAGWLGVKSLPEIKKQTKAEKRHGYPYEGTLHPAVKQHIFHVTRRWLDPNGDGNPSDGVDGFRLDVAPDVPLGFWREYRRFVRSIQPDALLVGEAWWTKWPDTLMDPRPFLKGDIFDSVMHYQWYRPARRFFAQANGGLSPSEFAKQMRRVYADYKPSTVKSLMNLAASHDSPRLATSFQNKSQYKFRMHARDNEELSVEPPTPDTLLEMRMLLLHQFTFVSAPHIWNGDELGMWGGDDPDCRKPIIWSDIRHTPQSARPNGGVAAIPIPIAPNLELLEFTRQLISMRKARPELVDGGLQFGPIDDHAMTLAYRRHDGDDVAIVVFNLARQEKRLQIGCHSRLQTLTETRPDLTRWHQVDDVVHITLPPLSGIALGTVRPSR